MSDRERNHYSIGRGCTNFVLFPTHYLAWFSNEMRSMFLLRPLMVALGDRERSTFQKFEVGTGSSTPPVEEPLREVFKYRSMYLRCVHFGEYGTNKRGWNQTENERHHEKVRNRHLKRLSGTPLRKRNSAQRCVLASSLQVILTHEDWGETSFFKTIKGFKEFFKNGITGKIGCLNCCRLLITQAPRQNKWLTTFQMKVNSYRK